MAVDTFGFPPGVASHGIEVFEQSGVFYPKQGVSEYFVSMCGGGGAGGFSASATIGGSGGSSGEGFHRVKFYIPAPQVINVGAGGAANGNAGAESNIGGTVNPLISIPTAAFPSGFTARCLGGAAGLAAGGSPAQTYGTGKRGANGNGVGSVASFVPFGGSGGGSVFGGGGGGGRQGSVGYPTTTAQNVYGAGGGGNAGSSNTTGYGGDGVVIIEW